jgi:hypothetical protein
LQTILLQDKAAHITEVLTGVNLDFNVVVGITPDVKMVLTSLQVVYDK